jgi:hypothetical protein
MVSKAARQVSDASVLEEGRKRVRQLAQEERVEEERGKADRSGGGKRRKREAKAVSGEVAHQPNVALMWRVCDCLASLAIIDPL